jgi:hypothetical protein
MNREALVNEMVSRLTRAVGERLTSVLLYGPEVHGDLYREVEQLNLMVVLADLEPATLRPLGDPVHWWLAKGQPWPRLFSHDLIRDSLDVYPIEFLDITRHHRVLHGVDPLVAIETDAMHLRLQCERELREKLMRLREGYVECRGVARAQRRLLAASFVSFAAVWRGCLHLLGAAVPLHDTEVAEALCRRLELDVAPFAEVARIAAGTSSADADETFARYYRALTQMVARIDRLGVGTEREGKST